MPRPSTKRLALPTAPPLKAIGRDEFRRRRKALLKQMGRDSIAIVPTAPVRLRNNDVE